MVPYFRIEIKESGSLSSGRSLFLSVLPSWECNWAKFFLNLKSHDQVTKWLVGRREGESRRNIDTTCNKVGR